MTRSIQKWQSDHDGCLSEACGEGYEESLQGHLMGEQHFQP